MGCILNSPATNPTCVNGLKAEYSPSSYLYLVANLGKDLSNNKSFRSSTTKSYSIESNEVPESILNIVHVIAWVNVSGSPALTVRDTLELTAVTKSLIYALFGRIPITPGSLNNKISDTFISNSLASYKSLVNVPAVVTAPETSV